MRCNSCDTAIGYNLVTQWWNQTTDPEEFEHPCPFCDATLYVHVALTVAFEITTFRKSQYIPPKPD